MTLKGFEIDTRDGTVCTWLANLKRGSERLLPRAPWLATVGFGFVAVATARAGDAPAALLPPEPTAPAIVSRAASDDSAPEAKPRQQRDPGFKYPPTYSSVQKGQSLIDVSGMLKKVTSFKIFGESAEKKPETGVQKPAARSPEAEPSSKDPVPFYLQEKPPAPMQDAEPTVKKPVPFYLQEKPSVPVQQVVFGKKSEPVLSPVAPVAVTPIRTVSSPAWRWYGYGAPVPGRNPYAPDGVYGQVQPNWYHQTGATPGAIPQPLPPVMPLPPELPIPNTIEPPLQMSRPTLAPPVASSENSPSRPGMLLAPETASEFVPEVRPAKLEMPLRPVGGSDVPPVQPITAATSTPVYRGHAPDKLVSDELLASLRKACRGSVTRIEIQPQGQGKLALKLWLAEGVEADPVAGRILRISELTSYQVELNFTR